MKLTYHRSGNYLLPDLGLTDEEQQPLGKYGRMRLNYLKEHCPGLFSSLLLSGKLMEQLHKIDKTCNARLELLISRTAGAPFRRSDCAGTIIHHHKSAGDGISSRLIGRMGCSCAWCHAFHSGLYSELISLISLSALTPAFRRAEARICASGINAFPQCAHSFIGLPGSVSLTENRNFTASISEWKSHTITVWSRSSR